MATVIGLIVGMLVGGLLIGSGGGALLGGIVGAFVGFIIGSRKERDRNMRPEVTVPTTPPAVAEVPLTLADRVSLLEKRVAILERAQPAGALAPESIAPATPQFDATMPFDVVAPATVRSAPQVAAEVPPADAVVNVEGTLPSMPAAVDPPPPSRIEPPLPPAPPNPLWAWIVGGNTLARIGV
jgi:hypothetical protein